MQILSEVDQRKATRCSVEHKYHCNILTYCSKWALILHRQRGNRGRRSNFLYPVCLCAHVCLLPKTIQPVSPLIVPKAQAVDSLWAGSKQLPLSDVIEEEMDHFPQGGNTQHTTTLTLIVSQYQSHLFIGAVWRDTEYRIQELRDTKIKWQRER